MKKGVYNGQSLITFERVTENCNVYTVNQLYKNNQYNIYWYINQSGYLHVLRPCKINNGQDGYSFNNLLLTKNNTLNDKGFSQVFNNLDAVIQYLENQLNTRRCNNE